MKKHTVIKSVVPLGLAGLLLAGCSGTSGTGDNGGSSQTAVSDTLRANWGGFPESWEPGSQAMEPGYMRVPYETLTLRESDGTILPFLASEWEFGEGAKSLTLKLQEGVKFHDGTDFNAEAVKANVEYVRDVVGGQFGGPLSAVEAIEAVDEPFGAGEVGPRLVDLPDGDTGTQTRPSLVGRPATQQQAQQG